MTDGADPAPGPSAHLVLRSAFLLVLGVGVPEPLAEVLLPAIGEPGGLRRAAEELLILRVDRPALALGRHREVEAGPAVPEHPLGHVHPAEPDPQLVAGQPRLSDDELSRPDPETVADPHVLSQPLGGQVLAEDGPGE